MRNLETELDAVRQAVQGTEPIQKTKAGQRRNGLGC